MNRSLKLSMLMALALGTSQAIALDLGQIQVKSALGQPLLAEIPVHPANPAELQNLTVQLASSEEFARAGIVGGRTVIPLHFSVANAAGGKVIRITSSEAVDDPYLDLLLEVNSNAGRSVREFAILLDPPSAAAAAPVAAAPMRRSATPTRPAQTRRSAAPRAAAVPKAAPAVSNGQYGPVERGQTLSSIARSAAPAGVDARQMMLALKQANPDAFYRDNINALKSGAILRVPTSAEAQAMTIAAAMAEVRRQNSDWRAGTPGQPAVVADTATRASASGAPGNTAGGAGDRLALVQAKDSKNAGGPGSSAAGKDDKTAASLRQDLLRNQESLASLQQQSSELKTRLKDMADINSKNEHLLSLKDSEIADLQAKLAAARKSASLPPATSGVKSTPSPAASAPKPALTETHMETATASTVASPTPAAASSSAVVTTALAAASSTAPATSMSAPNAAAVTPAAVKPAAKPVTGPTAAAAVEQPWYMQTWAWGAGAAAIALLLLLALLGRRRKPATASSSPKGASSLADRFGSTPAEQDLINGEDVDQEELLDQLAEHPDDIGLHLELVTLYYSRRDVEHFEAAAEAMHAHITDPQQDEWQDVMHMGEDLVPGHPLFDHHAELPVTDDAEARREFDIDDYADEADAPTVVSTMPPLPAGAPKKVSEYNFNFDLTRPAGTEPPHPPSSAADDATVVAPLAASPEAKAPPVTETSWHFDDAESAHPADGQGADEFNDDPIDTKLDLARAYLDMGDADGARAMLGEVMKEGSQMQRDTAKRLLDNLH